jgi:murein DD-endopeptidase MepM/ murein hydrolase activator NlpD
MFHSPLVATVMAGTVLVAQQAAPSAPAFDTKELGRQLTAQFFAGELDAVWSRFTPKMQEAMKSRAALEAFQAQVLKDMGTETEVIDEVVTPLMSYHVYMRTIRTQRWPQPVSITWSFDDKGQVAGFYVAPKKVAAASRHMDYRTRARLQLPFKGAWTVVWGGRTVEQNYHAMVQDQRFAYDFLIVKDGATHTGDGARNEQYFAYNQPILAPAPGKVVAAVDGLPDNVPGQMDPKHPAGNHVVIDHGNSEFSFLGHLKPGSLKVKVGQQVKAGALLGLCGNSGNSSEAHLHYHLQNAPGYAKGEGLPAQFQNYKADGKPVDRGEPTQGQIVSP